jgi:large subunit ribosomal protein L17
MRHARGNRKLSRAADQRLALLKSLVRSLFIYGKIKATVTRAKAARRLAEKLITIGKQNTLFARRRAEAIMGDNHLVTRLFKLVPEKFEGRAGGYTRLTRIGRRRGDAAPMAVLELL